MRTPHFSVVFLFLLIFPLVGSTVSAELPVWGRSHIETLPSPLPDYDIRVGYVEPGVLVGNDGKLAPDGREDIVAVRRQAAALKARAMRQLPRSSALRPPTGDLVSQRFGDDVSFDIGPSRLQLSRLGAPLTGSLSGTPDQAASSFLTDVAGMYGLRVDQVPDFAVGAPQTSVSGANHVNFQQLIDGIPVMDAWVKVSLSARNEVLSAGGTFFPDVQVLRDRALTPGDAVLRVASRYAGPLKSTGDQRRFADESDWQVRYVDDWTADAIARAKVETGPRVVRAERTPDERTWISRGPFSKDLLTRLVYFPVNPRVVVLAWTVSVYKSPTEVYQITVDARDGTLLRRQSMVQFQQGRTFAENPDDSPFNDVSYGGTAPATLPGLGFVWPARSGLSGNNAAMAMGANNRPGTDRDFRWFFTNEWETSGGTPNFFDQDVGKRVVFFRHTGQGYVVNTFPGAFMLAGPADPSLGMGDDTTVCGPPPANFDFFDTTPVTVCVSSNGNVTFEVTDPSFFEGPLFNFLQAPFGRVMALWDDFDPSAGGDVVVDFDPNDHLCYGWLEVPEFSVGGSNTFGVCLFSNDRIVLSYPVDAVDAPDGGMGIIPPVADATAPMIGTTSWWHFGARLVASNGVGIARFFPDTFVDERARANGIFWQFNDNGHDRAWFNGLEEPAGNFQMVNFGRGGNPNDPIIAAPMPVSNGVNNAFFGTPPDGDCCPFSGFFLFAFPLSGGGTNFAYSSLDSDVVIHEHAHGITNRLVGGADNSFALFSAQSGAMGEGWSDAFGFNYSGDQVVGEYSTGNPGTGIRNVAYTSNNGRSFDQFGNICCGSGSVFNLVPVFFPQVHNDGEIWASTLQSVREKLRAAGRSDLEFEELVMEAAAFTPTLPTYMDARNALLVADTTLFGGAHVCDLWMAFADRGLGAHADVNNIGNFFLPSLETTVFGSMDRPKGCGGMYSAGPIVFSESFESGAVGDTSVNGWDSLGASSLWHATDNRASDGAMSFWYGQETTGNYDTGAPNFGILRSPPLDLTNVSKPVLEFDVLLDKEVGTFFDMLRVRIPGPFPPGDQQRSAPSAGVTFDFFFFTGFQFRNVQIDLSPIANTDGNRIQIFFDTIDEFVNTTEGVYIDNIVIRDSVQQ